MLGEYGFKAIGSSWRAAGIIDQFALCNEELTGALVAMRLKPSTRLHIDKEHPLSCLIAGSQDLKLTPAAAIYPLCAVGVD